MRTTAAVFVSFVALGACDYDSAPFFQETGSLKFTSEDAGTIRVRGRDFPITKNTGRDEKTGEIFVIDYRTKVDGQLVTCVGSIDGCPAAIERALDSDRGDDDRH